MSDSKNLTLIKILLIEDNLGDIKAYSGGIQRRKNKQSILKVNIKGKAGGVFMLW